jgi:hypothetical protein
MGQRHVGSFAGERHAMGDDDADDDNGPKVACPFCDYLIPLRWAIGPHGRRPLTCPRCEGDVPLPGEPD